MPGPMSGGTAATGPSSTVYSVLCRTAEPGHLHKEGI